MPKLHFALGFVAMLAVGCKAKEKAPEPSAAPKPTAPAAGSGSAAEPAAPATPAAATPTAANALAFEPGRIGNMTSSSKLSVEELSKAFPGTEVKREVTEAEGDKSVQFVVQQGGKPILNVYELEKIGLVTATVLSGSIKDAKGIAVGSTYEQLAAAYSDLACERQQSAGGEEGGGPWDMVECKTPAMKGIVYKFDIAAAKKPKDQPAAQAAAGGAIAQIEVKLR